MGSAGGRTGSSRVQRTRGAPLLREGRLAIDVGFIGGFGRSGSTLIERVVGEIPGVCVLGEVRHLWRRGVVDNELCGCGERFHRCPFWSAVGDQAFGGWHRVNVPAIRALALEIDRMRSIPTDLMSSRLSAHHAIAREYADFFARVYTAATKVSGARIVIDSSKNASTAFALRRHESVQLRVIHVIRDSRGVAYSWTKQVPRPEASESGDRAFMDRYPPWRSALLWDAHNLALSALAARDVPAHRVYYEDFVARPVEAAQNIAVFLGLGESARPPSMSDSSVHLTSNHQVSGNPMRFKTGDVVIRHDDDWRSAMPRTAQGLVRSLTWPLMAKYGYSRRTTGRA